MVQWPTSKEVPPSSDPSARREMIGGDLVGRETGGADASAGDLNLALPPSRILPEKPEPPHAPAFEPFSPHITGISSVVFSRHQNQAARGMRHHAEADCVHP